MSDDLVRRLRFLGPPIEKEAADRIEELEAKALANKIAIMRLEAERNKFQLYLQRTHADLELEIAAVDGLNAKLAKAVDVGNKMAHSIEGNYYLPSIAKEWRTTLAELKGQDDA